MVAPSVIGVVGNHHTPYLYNMARALPDFSFAVLGPTTHAPRGWRPDQRPQLGNVQAWHESLPGPNLLLLAQTTDDLLSIDDYYPRLPLLFLSHNRPEMESGLPLSTRPFAEACISPMKASRWRELLPNVPRLVIPPGLDADEFLPWQGDGDYVLTVANGLARLLFNGAAWAEITRSLPTRLVGEHNSLFGRAAVGPAKSWDELKEHYRHARCYLSVNRWPYEDGYNLALLEAMAASCPVVALANETLPEVVAGCTVEEARAYIELALKTDPNDALLLAASEMNRQYVRQHHSLEAFRHRWLSVFNELSHE